MRIKVYGIYEEDEQCRYVGTAKEIAEEFDCAEGTISKAVKRGSKLKGKYELVELYEEESKNKYTGDDM